MKKRVLAIMLTCVFALSLSSCGNSSDKDAEIESLKAENAELKKTIEELQPVKEESEPKSSNAKKELAEMQLNEPFLVKTDNGSYKITMQEARKTDWWQRSNNGDTSKTIVVLAYEIENVDFMLGETDYSGRDGVLINSNSFRVSDENGYILNADNSTYSDYGFPEMVEMGYKAKAELP